MFDVTFFQREGFQVVRNLIPLDLIEETFSFLNQKKEESVVILQEKLGTKQLSEKLNVLIHSSELQSYERETQMLFSGHFSLATRLDPLLQKIPTHSNVLALFNVIFPHARPFLHLPPTARFVLPGNRFAAVPPHQDVSYNEQMEDFFVMWVPLCDIDEKRGGVQIFKGTNLQKQFPVEKDQGFWLSGIEDIEAEKVHFPMKRGDVLLLNKWIVHASMPNLSDSTRMSIDYRLFYGKSKKHSLDLEKKVVLEPVC